MTACAAMTASSAHADAPEGRSLPDPVRRIIFAKACDIPNNDTEADCTNNPACTLKRSTGEAFRPIMPGWASVFMMPWAVGSTVFVPALDTAGLEHDGEGAFWAKALTLMSGLPARVDAKGQPDESWARLMYANPAVVRWIQRELIPAPSEPMCGATAQQVYDEAFKLPVRQMADVYVQLKKSGLLARVPLEELERNVNTRKGRFAKRCEAITLANPDPDTRYANDYGCFWWLRRHSGEPKMAKATSTAILTLLADVLSRYDADYFKGIAKHFPKVEPAK
jgi:hypothetical protein